MFKLPVKLDSKKTLVLKCQHGAPAVPFVWFIIWETCVNKLPKCRKMSSWLKKTHKTSVLLYYRPGNNADTLWIRQYLAFLSLLLNLFPFFLAGYMCIIILDINHILLMFKNNTFRLLIILEKCANLKKYMFLSILGREIYWSWNVNTAENFNKR